MGAARHFSSCYSGTVEDPVTGTASGVMSAYYLEYIENSASVDMYIEQGHEIGREGIVHAWAEKSDEGIKVHIAGRAVKAKELEATI